MLAISRRTLFALFVLFSLTPLAMARNPFRGFENKPDSVLPEAQTREDVFSSQRWGDVVESFDEWISVQLIYTEAQSAELVQGIRDKIESLNLEELKAFLVDTEDRMAVLLSNEAAEVRRYLSVTTLDYRQSVLAQDGQIPNVFAVPVTQLRQELLAFERQRLAAASAHSEFNIARQQRVDTIREANRAQQQTIRTARSEAARTARVGRTNTRPRPTPRQSPQRNRSPQYVVNGFGNLFRLLP